MNIGIDCLALPQNISGAANYIINLTQNLLQTDRNYNIQVYCQQAHSPLFRKFFRSGDALIEIKILNRFHKLLYYEKYLANQLVWQDTDLFLATHYITPPVRPQFKIISVFHDMGFMLHKEYYPVVKKTYFRTMIPRFITRSEKIVTVSQNTLRDLNKTIPESRTKTLYIYPGINHLLNIQEQNPQIAATNRPFLLAVNSFEKRKNIPFIIDVFNILKQKYNSDLNLILVGRPNNGSQEIMRKYKLSSYKESIVIVHTITNNQLKYLYNNAALFLSASQYEGFGFTPPEAVSLGCPVLLFGNNVCRELFNSHSSIINSTDPYQWAEKINSEIRNNYSHKISYDTVSHLTWQNCANNFNHLFNSVLGISDVQRGHFNYSKSYSELRQRRQGI